tara:strand:- start:35 stop:622 length:588 start_codon:yes stop_codon:yes gene_type:complete
MGKYSRHREFEVHLTTFDGAQHLRLNGWLKRNDVIVRSEGIQSQKSALFFGSFIILINNIMLEKLKEDNLDRGLYCDINVLNSESDRWDTFNKPENIFDKIQDFLFSFQLKDKKDIESFIEEANNTSLALFKKSETFINDYIETKEMSYKEKIKDLDTMIEAFVEDERYEDCAFLVKIKDKLKLYHIKQKLKTDE